MEHQRVPRNIFKKRDEHWCNSGMQNSLVYPKSTRDEVHFPFIGSIAIPCSTEYSTSGLTSLRKLQIFSETPAWIFISEHQLEESFMHHISCPDESWFPVFDWRGEPVFHMHLKWSFPSEIGRWEGLCAFCFKWNVPREAWLKRRPDFPAVA